MEQKIFFSIITPVLNNSKIKNVFSCLKKQTFKNFEHIVVDGGSNKSVLKILNKNKKNLLNLIIEKDKGIYDAINKGIKLSRGNVIGVLNSDDVYYPKTLELVNKYFLNKKIDYLFGSVFKERLMHGFWPNKIWYKFNVYPAHSCGFFAFFIDCDKYDIIYSMVYDLEHMVCGLGCTVVKFKIFCRYLLNS